MVLILIKHNDRSIFLIQATLKTPVEALIENVTAIYNGRLKVERLCSEIEDLAKYGTMYPLEILSLSEEQAQELKTVDDWGEKCIPKGGVILSKDPTGHRNGRSPRKDMQEILINAVREARELVSRHLVLHDRCLTMKHIQKAISLLKNAVNTVYPMKLPPYDIIRMEFENNQDISGTQGSVQFIKPTHAELWYCGKEICRDKKVVVGDYVGKIEGCKVTMKLAKRGMGSPMPDQEVMTAKERKEQILFACKGLKNIKNIGYDRYSNLKWAAGNMELESAIECLSRVPSPSPSRRPKSRK